MFLDALVIICTPIAVLSLIALVWIEHQIIRIDDRLDDLEQHLRH